MPSSAKKLLLIGALLSLTLGLIIPHTALAQSDERTAGAKPQEKEEKTQADYDETYRLLNLFGDVFERTRAQYVDSVDDKTLIENAVGGMLSALDPHSSYLNEENFRDMQVNTRGSFGGLGIEVTMENGFVKVVSPIDDTPAFEAGVLAGDYITRIDGQAVLGMTLSDAVDKMRGKVGTKIKLEIRRENTPEAINITIKRDIIKIRSVRNRVIGNTGYIRITTFNQNTEPGVKKAIKEIKEELGKNLRGYVLDLRNNPGGLLDQAIAVSDAFLDHGEIVSTRGRDEDDVDRDNAHKGDLAEGLPIVVLINGGSASASEIVSGALQDHKRALILGTKSFGKGSVQTIIPIPNHGAMRLTTARYYTPSGRSIQAKGIEPDIIVEQAKLEALSNGGALREADLRGALSGDASKKKLLSEVLKEEAESENKKDDESPEKDDYQLLRALDLINGLSLYTDPDRLPNSEAATLDDDAKE